MLNFIIMKNKIIQILCIIFTLNIYSQVTVVLPLSSYDYPNGAYLQDTNNELLPYVGTWEGISNNKKYIFEFQKFTQLLSSTPDGVTYNYRDEIKVKFKVIDLVTNTVLYNGLSATSPADFPIYGVSRPHRGLFNFVFTDTDANCQNTLEFYLLNIFQPGKFKYCYFAYDDWWRKDLCNYTDRMAIPHFLPTSEFILTKI